MAGLGVFYLLLFFAILAYYGMSRSKSSGPSELAAHPERQQEILAQQRAAEMQDRLGLSDEQAKQVADVFAAQRPPEFGPGGPPPDFRKRGQEMREQLSKILTAEQQAKMEEMRGPGGPGGPRGPRGPMHLMDEERVNSLKEKMTPEQRDRFDNMLNKMKEHRPPHGEGPPPGMGPR